MGITVGIPRAMLYYDYFPLWEGFFRGLGADVTVSPPTTARILERGVRAAVNEACLPVKIAFGHVQELDGAADVLFVPRMVSVGRGTYTCPKLLGLPDMIRHGLDLRTPVVDTCVNLRRGRIHFYRTLLDLGRRFSAGPARVWAAYRQGLAAWHRYQARLRAGEIPEAGPFPEEGDGTGELVLGVLGHPYNIYDRVASLNLLDRLRELGARVITAEMLPARTVDLAAAELPKPLFWSGGRRTVGTAFHLAGGVDGLVHLVSFGCGPDSMVGELLERGIRRRGKVPFLLLTVDEHTAEAGLVTRLEAFVDLVRRRNRT